MTGAPALATRPWLICVAITTVMHGVTYLLNTLLPFHLLELGGSLAQVGALFVVTSAVAMVLRPIVGGWVDRYGARAVMQPGALALLGAGLALWAARTPAVVVAVMAGVGLANALLSTAGSIVVAATSAESRRGEALALYYVAASVGVALGPAAGFALAAVGGMPLSFAVVTAAAVAVAVMAAAVPDPPRASAMAPAPPRWPWSPHAARPAVLLILITFGHGPVYSLLALHARTHGLGTIAWFFPLMSGCTIASRLLLRRAADRLGRTAVLVPALMALALGYVVLAAPPSVPSLALAAVLLGAGTSMLYPTLVALVVDRTPEPERGRAIGTLSASWDLGVAVGSGLTGLIVQATSYGAGFLVAAATTLLGLAVFTWGERQERAAGSVIASRSASRP